MSFKSPLAQTPGIEYDELAIEVSVGPGGQQEVRILDSQLAGGARELFYPPYTVEELSRRLTELDDLLLQCDEEASRKRRRLAESIGEDLYGALFPGKIGEALCRRLDTLYERQARGRAGLRLRLSFGETMASTPEILGLPWELLSSPDRTFSVNSPETPLVRHLDLARPGHPIQLEPPIRVLAVLASPDGTRPIDLALHEEVLEAACERKGMELEILWRTPLNKLRNELHRRRHRGRPIHVLHFLGHGDFDQDGVGGLNFERSDGSRDRVPGRALAALINGTTVQMVVLTTCVGARMKLEKGHHPFTGSASALVAGGLPAVVGMQFPVSEVAAIQFTRSFYPHLAAGSSLEEAVTEGRLAILAKDSNTVEWASPVLFLRAPDGKLQKIKESIPEELPEDSRPTRRRVVDKSVGVPTPEGVKPGDTAYRDIYKPGRDMFIDRRRER